MVLISISPAAVIATAVGFATACDMPVIAPQAAGDERIPMQQGRPGRSHGGPWLDDGPLPQGAAMLAPACDTQAWLWRVHDHDDSDRPEVAFVPAPESGHLILVRHADRDRNETALNATGRARALALPSALADLALDTILIADFPRNAETAAPLAKARGLVPETRDPDSALAAALVQAADGGGAIWIGNVGNLAQLWDAYRLPGVPPVEYGEIAVLTARGGTWQVDRRSFAP